jgi:citrate synthase
MSTQTDRQATGDGVGQSASQNTLSVTDNRTGRSYEVPITDGTVRSIDFRQIKVGDDDFGLMTYDPAFMNTASCRSAITYLDGENGVLEYRGYPIEQLAEQATYLEVAYLLVNGDLPTQAQLDEWIGEITIHTFVHENVKGFMQGFRHDAHPMGMLLGSVGALSTFYPDANEIKNPQNRHIQTIRLIAKMPTLAAFAYRHSMGMPYVYPDNELRYSGNFLSMMYKMTELRYEPDPRLERALDILFILHADHEQNCSTNAVRAVGSSQVDPYSAVAAGIAALYGPLHGGANEAVLRMLKRIGSSDNIPDFIKGVKEGNERLMGFGHRVYKNYDPRARIIKKATEDVFAVTGKENPLLQIASELEKIALEDDYFVKRKLYPNVDFYSGLIYEALGLPVSMFPVMFAIGRTSGWIAQWLEMVQDSEQKIARPRQVYTGERQREYVPIESR